MQRMHGWIPAQIPAAILARTRLSMLPRIQNHHVRCIYTKNPGADSDQNPSRDSGRNPTVYIGMNPESPVRCACIQRIQGQVPAKILAGVLAGIRPSNSYVTMNPESPCNVHVCKESNNGFQPKSQQGVWLESDHLCCHASRIAM